MLGFSIGVSALQAAQQGLAVAGNNIANASTPGYHRQIANFSTTSPTQVGNLSLGNGVAITDINRAVSDQLDAALTSQLTQNGLTDASLSASTQIQQVLSSNLDSPATKLESMLNTLQSLSSTPTNGAAQQAAVASAANLANAFNSAASDLTQIRQGLDQSISGVVDQINAISKQIATLNSQIGTISSQGISANNLIDQRGQLVNDLAGFVGIQVTNGNNGSLTISASGGALLVAGGTAQTLVAGSNKKGDATIQMKGSETTFDISGGQLGGMLSQRNQTLAGYQSRLDTMAQQIAASFNSIQSTGLGGSGGFTSLTSQNGVKDATALLNAAGLTNAPTNGSLFIGVTDKATGARTITEVPFNPQTQSLQDVANSISSTVPNLQAYVNNQTGTMTITSNSGYTFDFTGGYQATPTTNLTTTTSTPSIGGSYTGSTNDNYNFTFMGDGTVGVTPGLQAQVTNQKGDVIATVDVGQGYQAGQPISIANGLTMSLGAGDVTTGDSFSTPVVAQPDSAGLLTSLGLNTMFTGSTAATLKVSSDLTSDPSRLATSRTGQPSDVSNLTRFTALGDASVLNGGTQTFSQYAGSMVTDIGTSVKALTSQQSTNATLTTSITTQQQSVSGVDTNEELAKVLQYQQLFAVASKYISAVNDALTSLLQIST
ncbi:flagellar hook-associated protein FlgK [Schlesneria paludicola]|uniref:flagellar hook-associated protein FlgK n=1 Tax=Schlesneria paludicola TaxID=360056 RepID=UPI00029A76A2|nr:flagellar hook-associated protein FlgK [Schlesneria paludicola]